MRLFIPILILLSTFLFSCSKTASDEKTPVGKRLEIRGADLSLVPELLRRGFSYKTASGTVNNPIDILKENGLNTVRLRLWHGPKTNTSSFAEVKNFSKQLRQKGLKVLLTVHYSDTWADPGQQAIPKVWQDLTFSTLKDSVSAYTQSIVSEIKPEYIQIGNEINNGFLWPLGDRWDHNAQFLELVKTATTAVRETNKNTKIILQYAGVEKAIDFFEEINHLDYDLIGLSYYPRWHGKDLSRLAKFFSELDKNFEQEFVLVETSYPYTLDYQDKTHNIIGSKDQILPEFSATPAGQAAYFEKLSEMVSSYESGIGVCYWGGEWITVENSSEQIGSPCENQALFDFDHRALPIVKAFKPEE